ncbi:MAG: phosphoribosylformylglycinamidine synthase subunit PurL, partial [Chloroflexota bacterium]
QQTAVNRPITPPFVEYAEGDGLVEIIPLTESNDDELIAISQERRLSMNLEEMQAVQAWYRGEGREPTDLELEMLAQTWSEHCVHKTFRAKIDYTGPDGETATIDGILKTYLRAATDKVAKPWVKSAFVDNAGIVAFTEDFDLAFKVETHNHPSALEPFGGANTGIGGCIRDVLGVSARPIANTDILCFGPQDIDGDSLPEGVLHPARVRSGVIAGIEDYGNKMGIPTVNGAIMYHPGYVANPLVYAGCLGILPVGSHVTEPQAGDLVVALGGRTGRDGLRGATFSSMEMDVSTGDIAGSSVQIGHPIMEKQVLEVILRARDEKLYTAITDCGAGGFSSAVGEMSEELGARIQLQNMPLKYPGLRPWEMWLSEAQERMVLAVPPSKLSELQKICDGQDVELTVLGEFTGDGRLQIFYGDRLVGDLSEEFLHDGIPQRRMKAHWSRETRDESREGRRGEIPSADQARGESSAGISPGHGDILLKLLAHPNIRSREETIRVYDHEVQGSTAVKPLVGEASIGPSDAAVLVPRDTQTATTKGVALSNGMCPQLTDIDPYNMAWAAIDEAIRNGVAVGADPDQMAILDNFCWGNPNLPDRLGALVRCSQGCYDAAVAFGTPYISGKDSLNNEYTGADGKKHAIPGTLLISAMGIVPDATKSVTMDFKAAGETIYLLGETGEHLAGSHWSDVTGIDGDTGPQPVKDALGHYRLVHKAMLAGLITAAHDCSEGGLAVALAEMALAGEIGAQIDLGSVLTPEEVTTSGKLFGESTSRLVLTVADEKKAEFETIMADAPIAKIGVTGGDTLNIEESGSAMLNTLIPELTLAFRGQLPPANKPANQQTSKPAHKPAPAVISSQPKVLVLHANGSNRDRDAALACEMAGGTPEIVHINQLVAGEKNLLDYSMLVVPGGFSYGDDLGAGVVWSADLRYLLGQSLADFVSSERPILGICNGFQVIVKSGLLEDVFVGKGEEAAGRGYSLTYNAQDHFECRWVTLDPVENSKSVFTQNMSEPIFCPVAHGEGRFETIGRDTAEFFAAGRVALTYAGGGYPANPNGSVANIAGICNAKGNVMGLMPHPENHVFPWQHPRFHRGDGGQSGLVLFENGIRYAAG